MFYIKFNVHLSVLATALSPYAREEDQQFLRVDANNALKNLSSSRCSWPKKSTLFENGYNLYFLKVFWKYAEKIQNEQNQKPKVIGSFKNSEK